MRYNHLDMLPIKAFQPVGKRMTLEGGGGDGGGGSTQSTSYSTNLPEYAQPYYQELLKQTGKQVFTTDANGTVTGMKPPTNLPQQTVAGFNPLQASTQLNIANMQTPGQFAQSTAGLTSGQNLGYDTAQKGLSKALSYQPGTTTANNVQADRVGTNAFGAGAAGAYMSPFQQEVTNTALREAMLKGNLDKQAGMLGSIGRGTFGGARQALIQSEQNRGLNQSLADIQYKGMQDAYNNAQAQFNADQARALQAQQANQATGLQAQTANQAAALQAAQMNQQGQQFGATLGSQLGLAGLQTGVDTSKALGALGTAQQQAELAKLTAQGATGAEIQALQQKFADANYQNAMAAQNYQKQQLQYYSDILRGNAGALGSTQVQYTPTPSATSQIAGLGLAGLGLSKALG